MNINDKLLEIDDRIFESKPPVFLRLSEKNEKAILFIAFTSEGSQGKAFDFFKFLQDYKNIDQLFISTCTGTQYGNFDKSKYSTIEKCVEKIIDIIDLLNIKTVVTIGSSKGGAGAIKYGCWLSKYINTHICAFSPKILVHKYAKEGFVQNFNVSCKYLKSFTIYFDAKFPPDRNHGFHFKKIANLIDIPGTQHNTVKILKNNGRLTEIVKSYIF